MLGAHNAEHVKQFVADSQLEISDSLFQNSIHWPLPVTSGAGPANRPAPARERANGPHNRKVWLPGGPHARSHHTVWLPADYVATSTRIGYWR